MSIREDRWIIGRSHKNTLLISYWSNPLYMVGLILSGFLMLYPARFNGSTGTHCRSTETDCFHQTWIHHRGNHKSQQDKAATNILPVFCSINNYFLLPDSLIRASKFWRNKWKFLLLYDLAHAPNLKKLFVLDFRQNNKTKTAVETKRNWRVGSGLRKIIIGWVVSYLEFIQAEESEI